MKFSLKIISFILITGLCCVSLCSASVTGELRSITDMTDRTVQVPVPITGVLSTAPPTTSLVYMVAPDLLMGWNFKPEPGSDMLVPDKYLSLPVVGGWYGKTDGNYETFIDLHPSVILEGRTSSGEGDISAIEERQIKFGAIPVLGLLDTGNAKDYSSSIRFTGDLLNREEQADKLILFYEDALQTVTSTVSSIPEEERVRVYYAEGPEGLSTDPSGSVHSQLIDICGGINVAETKITPVMGMSPVSMEQISSWNPDLIIVQDPSFYEVVYTDPVWQHISAVKNHRVYLPPKAPFSWVDRPPGTNQVIGLLWTLHVLYPEYYAEDDLAEKVRYYYQEFYHVDLTDDQLSHLMESVSSQ